MMIQPDEWTIKSLYYYYANRIEATEQFYKDGTFSYDQYCQVKETVEEEYVQAMRLVFSKRLLSFGLVLPVAEFAEEWHRGLYCDCDGMGDFLDWDGNELGPINNFQKVPEGTKFVAWYNK